MTRQPATFSRRRKNDGFLNGYRSPNPSPLLALTFGVLALGIVIPQTLGKSVVKTSAAAAAARNRRGSAGPRGEPKGFLELGAAAVAPQVLPSAYNLYKIEEITAPPGADPLRAWINNRGAAAISYQFFDNDGGEQGSAVEAKRGWDILARGGIPFWAAGQPTSAGEIGGSYFQGGIPAERGAKYRKGEISIYPALSGYPNASWRIDGLNERGWMVGTVWDPFSDTPAQGVLTDGSLSFVRPLNAPWAITTFPRAINSRNVVVGTSLYFVDGFAQWSGFYLEGGTYQRIDVPESTNTTLSGVNSRGDAAGYYARPREYTSGLILSKGELWDFFIPGSVGTMIDSITDNGKLSGVYRDANGTDHIFVASPRAGGP